MSAKHADVVAESPLVSMSTVLAVVSDLIH